MSDQDKLAYNQACALATTIHRDFFKEESPAFQLCDSTAGVLTQIDNMYASLRTKIRGLERQVRSEDSVTRLLKYCDDVGGNLLVTAAFVPTQIDIAPDILVSDTGWDVFHRNQYINRDIESMYPEQHLTPSLYLKLKRVEQFKRRRKVYLVGGCGLPPTRKEMRYSSADYSDALRHRRNKQLYGIRRKFETRVNFDNLHQMVVIDVGVQTGHMKPKKPDHSRVRLRNPAVSGRIC